MTERRTVLVYPKEQIETSKKIIASIARMMNLHFDESEIIEVILDDKTIIVFLRSIKVSEISAIDSESSIIIYRNEPIVWYDVPHLLDTVVFNEDEQSLMYKFSSPKLVIMFPCLVHKITIPE